LEGRRKQAVSQFYVLICLTRILKLICAMQFYRLGVCENKVPKGMFEPEREKVTGGWRELHE